MRRRTAPSLLLTVMLGFAVLGPQDATAQTRPSGNPAPASWSPIQLGARFGYDDNSNGEVVGAQIRIPVLPSGMVELVPNADVTFLPGLKEYQFAVDAIFVTGGRRGGLYGGVGLAMRNSIFINPDRDLDLDSQRETKTGPAYVLGLRSSVFGASFGTQLEIRWIRVDDNVRPRVLTFGVNFPLWGRGDGGR